jgi:hypothetical protein
VYMYLRTRSSAAASVFMQPNGDQFIDFLFRHDQPGWSGRGPTLKIQVDTHPSTVWMTGLRNITQVGMASQRCSRACEWRVASRASSVRLATPSFA